MKIITTLLSLHIILIFAACSSKSDNNPEETPVKYDLSVSVIGQGNVLSSPAGIDCGQVCSATFNQDSIIILTPSPTTGSEFLTWTGDADCVDGRVSLSTNINCTANFATVSTIPTYTLSIGSNPGTGSGVVTSNPVGIDCGADCSQDYDEGSNIILTATPDAGSQFVTWSGAADCSDGDILLTSTTVCTPTFDLIPTPVRFVVLGDTGAGNLAQQEVANAIQSTCASIGCDFVILLGDNIYDTGVDSASDPQFTTKFETPYTNIDLPFYPILGFSDYGTVEPDVFKGQYQVAYSNNSQKWNMPNTYYTLKMANVGFIMLDTTSIQYQNILNGDQNSWLATAFTDLSSSEWIFVMGHHPYRSNGAHGNAGSYEYNTIPIDITKGVHVKTFFDSLLCGKIDYYFSAHDHNRQWLNEPAELCGAEMLVSGVGSKTTLFSGSAINNLHYGDDTIEGFTWIEVDGSTVTGRFYDKNGVMNYQRITNKLVAFFDFKNFNGSGFSPTPAVGQLDSDLWAITGLSDGILDFGGTQTAGDFARGLSAGNVLTSGIYSFDSGTGNQMLGIQPSAVDFNPGNITLKIQNNTGGEITNLQVSYTAWALNNEDRSTSLNFSYSTDGIVYTDVPTLELVTPTAADAVSSWVSTPKQTTISGIGVAINNPIYFRWTSIDVTGTGSRDEIGIDNIRISKSL